MVANSNSAVLTPELYRIHFDAMMRSDRAAAAQVFDHAAAIGDLETLLLAYYGMAGPVIVEGPQDIVATDLGYISEFLVPTYFPSLNAMVPVSRTLSEKGHLNAFDAPQKGPGVVIADIPVRSPGGALYQPGGSAADVVISGYREDEFGRQIPTPVLEQAVGRTTQVVTKKKKKSGGGGGAVILVALAVGGGLWYRDKQKKEEGKKR